MVLGELSFFEEHISSFVGKMENAPSQYIKMMDRTSYQKDYDIDYIDNDYDNDEDICLI